MRLPVAFYNSIELGLIIGEPVKLGKPLFGTSEEYDLIIPKIKNEFKCLLEDSNKDLRKALDNFLKKTSLYAILGYDLIKTLAEHLNVNEIEVIKILVSTEYIQDRIEHVKENFKKKVKDNPLEYAEEVGELVALLGVENAYNLLRKNNIRIGKTTLNCFYKVSMMPSKIKKLIAEKKLPLTIAFELPEKRLEEAAEKVAELNFSEARKILKEIKRNNFTG
ncbi:MAG: hypothetical protein QXW80_06640 [Candidatus Micrarchaeia archaeon]